MLATSVNAAIITPTTDDTIPSLVRMLVAAEGACGCPESPLGAPGAGVAPEAEVPSGLEGAPGAEVAPAAEGASDAVAAGSEGAGAASGADPGPPELPESVI